MFKGFGPFFYKLLGAPGRAPHLEVVLWRFVEALHDEGRVILVSRASGSDPKVASRSSCRSVDADDSQHSLFGASVDRLRLIFKVRNPCIAGGGKAGALIKPCCSEAACTRGKPCFCIGIVPHFAFSGSRDTKLQSATNCQKAGRSCKHASKPNIVGDCIALTFWGIICRVLKWATF